jgi:hypothetical protein
MTILATAKTKVCCGIVIAFFMETILADLALIERLNKNRSWLVEPV